MEENQMETLALDNDSQERIETMTDEQLESHLEEHEKQEEGDFSERTDVREQAGEEAVREEPLQIFDTQMEWQRERDHSIGNQRENGIEGYQALLEGASEYYGIENGEEALQRLLEDIRQQEDQDSEEAQIAQFQQEIEYHIEEEIQSRIMQIHEQELQAQYEQQIERHHQLEAHANNRIQDIRTGWLQEAERVAAHIPDFDLKKILREDPAFGRRLVNGMQVDEAYYLSQRDEAMKNACAKPDRKPIRENGKSRAVAGVVRSDPAHLPDDEFEAYIQRLC